MITMGSVLASLFGASRFQIGVSAEAFVCLAAASLPGNACSFSGLTVGLYVAWPVSKSFRYSLSISTTNLIADTQRCVAFV